MDSIVITQLTASDIREIFRQELKSFFSNPPNGNNQVEIDEDSILIEEAAIILKVAINTIYGYVRRKQIPCSKPEGTKRLKFSRKELTEWNKSGRKKTSLETNREVDKFLSNRKGKRGSS